MAVYNGEKYLEKSIESILKQTFSDFEFIIIDDCSTDRSAEIIKSYLDPRIVYQRNDANLGLAGALNRGLDLARGEFIARMDADDISRPDRLEKQYHFLKKHPAVGLCGTWIKIISSGQIWKTPPDRLIAPSLLFNTPFFHPTMMFRLDIFRQNKLAYDETCRKSQDYELWLRAIKHLAPANLKEPLVDYRVTDEQISDFLSSRGRQEIIEMIRKKAVAELIPSPLPGQLTLHQKIARGEIIAREELPAAEDWLWQLAQANKRQKIYRQADLEETLGRQWLALSRKNRAGWKTIINSRLFGQKNSLIRMINFGWLIAKIKLLK